MNPTQLLKAAKIAADFQSDPDRLKEYTPVIDQFLTNILRSAKNTYPNANHLAIMVDTRDGLTCLHLVDIQSDGTLVTIDKVWLQGWIDNLRLDQVPGVVVDLMDGPQPWTDLKNKLNPAIKPVHTFSEFIEDETEFDRLKHFFPKEYETGHCQTLFKLLKNHFGSTGAHDVLNVMKLGSQWSLDFYERTCYGLFFENSDLLDQIKEDKLP